MKESRRAIAHYVDAVAAERCALFSGTGAILCANGQRSEPTVGIWTPNIRSLLLHGMRGFQR